MCWKFSCPSTIPSRTPRSRRTPRKSSSQLHQGAPFPVVARQFSQHPTAGTGGDMGWVNEGQLAPELNAVLAKMEVGNITPPIRSTGGYYVLGLRERQEPLGTKIADAPTGPTGPAGTLPLARLLFPADPRAPKAQLEEIMKVAVQIQHALSGLRAAGRSAREDERHGLYGSGRRQAGRPQPADPGGAEEHQAGRSGPALPWPKPASN